MLQFELWTALYLVLGVATFLYYKSLIEENTTDSLALGIAAFMVIAVWWVVLIADLAGFVYYKIKTLLFKRHICGAKFPQSTMNVDIRCGLHKHDAETLHEGVSGSAYGRWHVDEDGTVFIDRVSTY